MRRKRGNSKGKKKKKNMMRVEGYQANYLWDSEFEKKKEFEFERMKEKESGC